MKVWHNEQWVAGMGVGGALRQCVYQLKYRHLLLGNGVFLEVGCARHCHCYRTCLALWTTHTLAYSMLTVPQFKKKKNRKKSRTWTLSVHTLWFSSAAPRRRVKQHLTWIFNSQRRQNNRDLTWVLLEIDTLIFTFSTLKDLFAHLNASF